MLYKKNTKKADNVNQMPFVSRYVYRNFFHSFWNRLHANATNSQRTFAERSVLCFSDASLRAVKCVQYDLHHHNNLLSNERCLVRNNGKTSDEGVIYTVCLYLVCVCVRIVLSTLTCCWNMWGKGFVVWMPIVKDSFSAFQPLSAAEEIKEKPQQQ